MFKTFKTKYYLLYLLTVHTIIGAIFWIVIFEILDIG